MRRADRLFQIVQFLRSRRLTTAEWLASKLEVSKRTIYRDVEDLVGSGVPIEGEAGVGYVLRRKLDLPPLMFDRTELAAIELGLRFVGAYTDRPLTQAAVSAMAKIRSVLPDPASAAAHAAPLYVPRINSAARSNFGQIFAAVDEKRKAHVSYEDASAQSTERVIWPLGVFFWGNAWTVLSWCELRNDFRSFRTERIRRMEILEEHYPDTPGRRLADYFRWMENTHAVPMSDFDPHE
jgi:predicted DNA-binding transcriptional regulator YafY